MKLILSPSAISDLQSISEYTLQTWGAEQEEHYLKGLWKKLAEIQFNPEFYRLRKNLVKGCRFARHQKHVIFYAYKAKRFRSSASSTARWASALIWEARICRTEPNSDFDPCP